MIVKGKTSDGFAFEYDAERLDDMRLVDVIAEASAPNASDFARAHGASVLLTMILGAELKAALYEHIGKSHDGRVPQAALEAALTEIMATAGGKDAVKNS